MTEQLPRVRMLRIAIILTALFNLLALFVLIRGTPISFTVFMFVGEILFVLALILLVAAVLADLRAKQLL